MSEELLLMCPECKAVQPVKHDFCVRCGASLESAQVVRSLSPSAAERTQTPQATEQKSTKSRVPFVVALIYGIGAVAAVSNHGGSSEEALLFGVGGFLFWWVVLTVVFRLAHPENQGAKVGLVIATIVGVPAITAVIGFLLLVAPAIGSVFNPVPTPSASQPAAIVPTSLPRPTPSEAWELPSWLSAKPSPRAGSTGPATTQLSLPRTLPSPTHRPVQPSPVQPAPTGGNESFNQTVTAIGNWLATEEVNATVGARQEAITPTPAICRENVSIGTPRHGSTVKGLVGIHGTATLPGFQFYKLEFSSRAQPKGDEWITIGGVHDRPVVNGELGVWDTSSLPNGQHWLRLVVVDQTGNHPEPCVVLVIVSK